MTSNRLSNTKKNVLCNTIVIVLQSFFVFFTRYFFVKYLNQEYVGIQGFFTSIISMLSLADMGIAIAISYFLYKPLADNNIKKVSCIISYLRRIYFAIGIIIICISLVLMPFIHHFVTGYTKGNLEIIFVLFFVPMALEYILAYPETLITADQKRYKIFYVFVLYTILTNILQIVFLIITQSYFMYLIIELLFRIIKYILINIHVKKEYKKIDFNSKEKLSKSEKETLIDNIKALFFARVGDYLVNGTDNLIISKFLNIVTVSIYSNYYSIITLFKNLLLSMISGISSSYGNLISNENEESQENVFNIINFLCFIFNGIVTICLFFIINKFILLLFGEKYLLNGIESVIICVNYYIMCNIIPLDMVKTSAGVFKPDKYISIIQAIINIIVSIVLSLHLGLVGVLLGTLISYSLTVFWERPFIVYKLVFKKGVIKYVLNYISNTLVILFNIAVDWFILGKLSISNSVIDIISSSIIVVIVFMISVVVVYHNKEEYKYIKSNINKMLRRNKA